MIETYLNKMKQDRHAFVNRALLVLAMSVFVVTAVFWQLKLTGITLAGEAFCGMEEHIHDETCLAEDCTKTEHTHIDTCYSNREADVETQEIWEETLAEIEYTGYMSTDFVSVARSQVGYTESIYNYEVDSDGTRRGYTRYGEWYGNPYGNWSAMFVSFCLHYADIPTEIAPYHSGAETMRLAWDRMALYADAKTYAPTAGDVVFLDPDGDGAAESVGIVCENSDGVLTVIAGNHNDAVCEITLRTDDNSVLGYGSMRAVIRANATEEELAEVETVSGMILALPLADVVEETLAAYEDAEDWDGYERYYQEIGWTVIDTFFAYETLGDDLQLLITDTRKLYDLEWLRYSPMLLISGITSDKPTVVQSADTSDLIRINLYDYGSKINTLYNSNNKYPGFQWNGGAYLKGTYNRHSVDYIDFGNSMITDFKYGSSSSGSNGKSSNAQNIVKTDDSHGAINKIMLDSYGVTNRPIGFSTGNAALQYTLKNGYPALSDGTSLAYLFSGSTYATKQNTANINGLFRYDEQTGEYYYNSRENHAQYNSGKNTFTLYNQVITPNFIVYPFGNFLPFNDITDGNKATQVSKIQRVVSGSSGYTGYIQTIINRLLEGTEDSTENQLVDMLAMYRTSLDSVAVGSSTARYTWNAAKAINDYFTGGEVDGYSGPEFTMNGAPYIVERNGTKKSLLQSLYNIDYDVKTNFFFGMDMHMDFLMAKDGMAGKNGDQPMVYEFSGDDDVWIYIDGVLFLDLSGIHRHVGGKIDFVNGKVYYYALETDDDGEVSTTPYKTYTFAQLLKQAGKTDAEIRALLPDGKTFGDYTEHTLDFYYMERGSGSSVCEMSFNLPLLPDHRISVTKELDGADAAALGNPDFTFQLLAEDGTAFVKTGTEYTVMSASGSTSTRKTGENGTFTLKAGETAVFEIPADQGKYFVRELLDAEVFEQYGTVTVDGKSTTKDSYTDVTVGSSSFVGVESDRKDVKDGNTSFTFTNTVDPHSYGSLEISKLLQEYSASQTEKAFTFTLLLDGTPVPAGTRYILRSADGTETSKTVQTAGQITFLSGQTARLEKILAGTSVTLTEQNADGYTVLFRDGAGNALVTSQDGSVSFVIRDKTATAVTVINDRLGAKLTVNGQKTLLYPDGKSHTFSFTLRQVQADGSTAVENGIYLTSTVTLESGSQGFSFTLNFPYETVQAGTYYFRITEDGADAAAGGDTAFYLLEVELSKDGGQLTVKNSRLLKNGTEPATEVGFTNRNVQKLTVGKTVEGVDASGQSFAFTLRASAAGEPLSGNYLCQRTLGGNTVQETLTFADGVAAFSLQDGETLTVLDLPYGTVWTLNESASAGFYTEYASDGAERVAGSTAEGTLESDSTVQFYNLGGYELPSTGYRWKWLFAAVGGLLMACAFVGAVVRRKKM